MRALAAHKEKSEKTGALMIIVSVGCAREAEASRDPGPLFLGSRSPGRDGRHLAGECADVAHLAFLIGHAPASAITPTDALRTPWKAASPLPGERKSPRNFTAKGRRRRRTEIPAGAVDAVDRGAAILGPEEK